MEDDISTGTGRCSRVTGKILLCFLVVAPRLDIVPIFDGTYPLRYIVTSMLSTVIHYVCHTHWKLLVVSPPRMKIKFEGSGGQYVHACTQHLVIVPVPE